MEKTSNFKLHIVRMDYGVSQNGGKGALLAVQRSRAKPTPAHRGHHLWDANPLLHILTAEVGSLSQIRLVASSYL